MNATRLVAIDYGDDDAGVLPTISTTHSIDLDNRQRQSIIAKITAFIKQGLVYVGNLLLLLCKGKAMEDVWSLENSMRRYTLRFLDPKIEQSYVLYVNRKYMRYNRLLAIFLVCLSCLSVIYNWLVETWARFIIYLPCNIAMALFCAILFLSTFSTGSLLYYQHLTTTVLLFLTGLSWMFGQPLVLLLLGDPLVLDSAHLIFMFIVFNVAMTPLKVSLISATALCFIQLMTCMIGLPASGRPWTEAFDYLLNNFLTMALAFLFAFLAAFTKEQLIRKIYLVRHFQRQEAAILKCSRLRLAITEAGMKAMKNSSKIPPVLIERLSVNSGGGVSSGSNSVRSSLVLQSSFNSLPRTLGKRDSEMDGELIALSDSSRSPNPPENAAQIDVLQTDFDPLLRHVLSSHTHQSSPSVSSSTAPVASPSQSLLAYSHCSSMATNVNTMDQNANDFPVGASKHEQERHMFIGMLSELPHWIISLPQKLHVNRGISGLRAYFKFKIGLHSGDNEIEKGFQNFYGPVSVNSVRFLMIFAIIGGASVALLNVFIQKVEVFQMIIRVGVMPVIALACFGLTFVPAVGKNTRRTQMLILASVYLLTVSYMAIAFNSHLALRRSYAAIDPYSSTPALNTPSRRKDHSNSADAMADQGDNSGDKIVAAIRRWFNSASSVFKKQSPSASNSSSDNSGRNKNGSAASANEQQYLIENYLAAEADYITSLNTLVLFCIFCASSAGLRLAYYLLYASGAFLTVLSATIYTASVMGIDGRQIGMILSVMTAVIAGIWIARPLESERRRWYNLKVNYNL